MFFNYIEYTKKIYPKFYALFEFDRHGMISSGGIFWLLAKLGLSTILESNKNKEDDQLIIKIIKYYVTYA
jgi:hypothetical protein